MANPAPYRWLVDSTDPTKLDSVAAHICALASYYAYYRSAGDVFRATLGATNVLMGSSIGSSETPLIWLVELPECNIIVVAGTTNYQQLYNYLRNPFYLTPSFASYPVQGNYYSTKMANGIAAEWDGYIRTALSRGPTFFTGHSLGGMVAASLCVSIRNHYPVTAHPQIVYTFGSPRAGNKSFAAQLPHSYAVQVPGDICPLLPPSSYFGPGNVLLSPSGNPVGIGDPFAQHGVTVSLEEKGNLTTVDDQTIAGRISQSVEWDALRVASESANVLNLFNSNKGVTRRFSDALESHEMWGYLQRLQSAIPSSSGQKPLAYDKAKEIESELPAAQVPLLMTIEAPATALPPAVDPGVVPLHVRTRH